MGIIQIKNIEFYQDDRGWCIRPITDDDIKNDKISDIHMVSMKPGAVRGNHYHINKTENILIIGSTCRLLVVDNNTNEKEEKIIENSDKKLFIIPPEVTHAIENIGNETSFLLCFSEVHGSLKNQDMINNKII
ncbi:dTDP-4-dehydrorhamnose 3,5-epimerase and related enzymes [Candidatus Scalindua japonica]|uniref:dTDP-4-dehydrorhamnose 3,5-epimerase and related enzymes n=1 Tax=Candidatus Scalindua japonica TaxID=1284222 RepID=A0A286U2H8_9BACT|nr:cupin domain-containing protein [Candidatus Scalindua japonica]GAX62332.1 dTDP-4-dehydrorhamnose 3,5-epimerase and related enzymes [Candidatus Scalindua japonica]